MNTPITPLTPDQIIPDLSEHRRIYLIAVLKTLPVSLYEIVRDCLYFTKLIFDYTSADESERNWDDVVKEATPLGKNIIYATANIAAIITLIIPILGYPGILVDKYEGNNDTLLGLIIPQNNAANPQSNEIPEKNGESTLPSAERKPDAETIEKRAQHDVKKVREKYIKHLSPKKRKNPRKKIPIKTLFPFNRQPKPDR